MFRSLLVVAASAAVASAAPPPEFAHVPADAVGVAHVRAADLWKHPSMAALRATLDRAGADAVADLDRQFRPAPSTIDRLTAFVTLGRAGPEFVVLVRFSKPFDPKQVQAASLADAKPVTAGGKTFYVAGGDPLAFHFLDNQTVAVSDQAGMTAFVSRPPAAGGPAFAKLFDAAGDKPVVVAVRPQKLPLPKDALAQVPADFQPLLAADLVTLSVGLDPVAKVAVRMEYADEAAATAAEGAVRKGLDLLKPFVAQQKQQAATWLKGNGAADGARPLAELPQAVGGLFSLSAAAELEALMADPPLKRAGNTLAAELNAPGGVLGTTAVVSVGVGLLLPAVQKVREAAARAKSSNNLKQIGLALHMYHDAHGAFPPAAVTDKATGKKLLSWRVAILPYLEQDALYKQFKLDEPWDSPANLPLSKLAISVYTDPRGTVETPTHLTYYKALVGGGSAWDWAKGKKLTEFHDGTSNTLLVGTFGPAVPWAAPDDAAFDPKGQLPDLFTPPFNGLLAAFADGSVRFIRPGIDPKVLKAIITASGGEDVSGLDR